MRFTCLLLLFACGCHAAPRRSEPPSSPAAIGFADRLPTILKDAADDDGWVVTIVADGGANRLTVDGVKWEWSEQTIPLIFIVSKPNRPDKPLTTAEATTLMKSLRGELRTYLKKQGAEGIGAEEGEAFHERTLNVTYRNGRIDGRVTATLTPNSEAAEETGNKLLVVIREVYGRE